MEYFATYKFYVLKKLKEFKRFVIIKYGDFSLLCNIFLKQRKIAISSVN